MCLEGKQQHKWKQIGSCSLQCLVCRECYYQKQWDELVATTTPKVTTMGGGSGEGEEKNEQHCIDIKYEPMGRFVLYCDGSLAGMQNAMDLLSAAAERLAAATPNPKWNLGTQAAYERLGRALGLTAPTAPPTPMDTEELSKKYTTDELIQAAQLRIQREDYEPTDFAMGVKRHAQALRDAVCGPGQLTKDDLRRFSLTELLAHLNERTAATKTVGGSFDGGVHDAVRQLHERVNGSKPRGVWCKSLTPEEITDLADQTFSIDLMRALEDRLKRYLAGPLSRNSMEETKLRELVARYTAPELQQPVAASPPPAAAPAEPLKLAQRLAAFVTLRAELEKACVDFDAVEPTTSYGTVLFRAALLGKRRGGQSGKAVVKSWDDGTPEHAKYMEQGFVMHQYSDIVPAVDPTKESLVFRIMEF